MNESLLLVILVKKKKMMNSIFFSTVVYIGRPLRPVLCKMKFTFGMAKLKDYSYILKMSSNYN